MNAAGQGGAGPRSGRVAGSGADGWCLYASGYKRAAELLVEHVRTTYELNTVVFPILFLYRHYLEVILKEIIGYARYLDATPEGAPGGHGLDKLWAEAKALIRRHARDVPAPVLARLDVLIAQLSNLDSSSEGTRYPITKDRVASFHRSAPPVDLDQFAREMKEMASLIEPIASKLSLYQDLEAEFRSDYYRGL